MAVTKVSKAADIILKNPEITNIALARMVKAKNPESSGWQLRRNAEKYIDRKGLQPKKKKGIEIPDPIASPVPTKAASDELQSLGAKVMAEGGDIIIRIPAKSLGSILLTKLLH